MLGSIFLAKDEEIERSKIICQELENQEITNQKRSELLAELERLTGRVLRIINDEILADLNNLESLLKGNFLKKSVENYEVEIENKERIDRWGFSVDIVDGVKMAYDPLAENPRYEKIPMMTVERSRVMYLCETNREQVLKIKEILMKFWGMVKNDFKHTSIDKILMAKRYTESQIAKIDRLLMKRETLTELDFQDSDYIKKPARQKPNPIDQQNDLFRRYDSAKASINA